MKQQEPGLERDSAISNLTGKDRDFILAAARNDAHRVNELLPWVPVWLRERALRLVVTFDHLATAQVLLESIGSSSIDVLRFTRSSRPMQRLILEYDPLPDTVSRVSEPPPVPYGQEPEQGELPL